MKLETQDRIIANCPLLFKERDTDLAVGEGWAKIVENLCNKIEEILKTLPQESFDYGIYVSQVKEKFGGLRFYMSSETEEMSNLIDEAEAQSYITCELCGNPGTLRQGGWLLTLCNVCDANRKKNVRN